MRQAERDHAALLRIYRTTDGQVCGDCGNVFVSIPSSCPGCAGREFK